VDFVTGLESQLHLIVRLDSSGLGLVGCVLGFASEQMKDFGDGLDSEALFAFEDRWVSWSNLVESLVCCQRETGGDDLGSWLVRLVDLGGGFEGDLDDLVEEHAYQAVQNLEDHFAEDEA